MPRAINTERIQIEMKDTSMMQAFFLSVWIKRPHKSELDSTYLGNTHLSIYFHHILPKKKFPQAKYDPENIILLTLDQHSNVESDMYRYPEINRRRELLKLKYDVT